MFKRYFTRCLKEKLHKKVCFFDDVNVTTTFWVSNNRAISKVEKPHGK